MNYCRLCSTKKEETIHLFDYQCGFFCTYPAQSFYICKACLIELTSKLINSNKGHGIIKQLTETRSGK